LQRQLDFLEQAAEAFACLTVSLGATKGRRQDRLVKHGQYSRQAFETSLASARELAQLTARAANDVVNVVTERFWDSLEELRLAQEMRNAANASADRSEQAATS